ncbi:MAG TPA: hypothetical protein VI603_00655 [Saprospiraceae bacterium]|nr:hypothetical protein [Saprospiraceae bacterium]
MAEGLTVSQKINELFAYRRIPELLNLAGIEKDSPFVARLYALQEVIYALDQYLETNWVVKKKELKKRWDEIYDALSAFGIRKKDYIMYTSDVERYERYELDLRKNKLPVNRSFETLYSCKSCDVKLIRTLIYRHAPDLKKKLREKEWEYYDLITEVNDDIQDVFEDCESWNGNRFLISVLVRGKGQTRRAYRDFLDKTGKEARKHFKKNKEPYHAQLFKWTMERLQETEDLLRETMDGQKLYLVNHSAIAVKIKK